MEAGERFTRLVVSEKAATKKYHVVCVCDCGATREVCKYNLIAGNTKSCGCLSREKASKMCLAIKRTKHGECSRAYRSPEYRTWQSMKSRCLSQNCPGYFMYGGRGIKVCERWMKFENFLADMGRKPLHGHSIDRIDCNGDYEPSNCRWADDITQHNNTRKNVHVEIDGETLTLAMWARRARVTYNAAWKQYSRYGLQKAIAFIKSHIAKDRLTYCA